MDWIGAHERAITGYALERLQPFVARGLQIYGPKDIERRSGVISFNFADIHAHDLASILDIEGVCVRAGHHCTMPLMEKMNWPATARASFYLYNTERDVDQLVEALEEAARIFKVG
jgi:cysteine desulfurase/selenocysteine lyase